jgi:hypothetical protein
MYSADIKYIPINLESPVNGLILEDSGLLKIERSLNKTNFSDETFLIDIFRFLKSQSQDELLINFFNFLRQVNRKYFSSVNEITFYSHELIIANQSGFCIEVINKIFLKLTGMLDSNYDKRIEGDSLTLVGSCLRDIAFPASISQQMLNTCSATCIQHIMSIKEPLEYLNIIDALAQNNSYFSLNKKVMDPNWSFNSSFSPFPDSRSITAKIFQNAVMDLEPKWKKFNSAEFCRGQAPVDALNVFNAIVGTDYIIYENADFTSEQLIEIIKKSNPSRTNPVHISMFYINNGFHALHSLNIINYDHKYQDIIAFNPWGHEEIIGVEVLRERINCIIAPAGADKTIPRLPEPYFTESLKTHNLPCFKETIFGISIRKNWPDENLNKYLNCLNMSQKVELILTLFSFSLSKTNKIMILKILKNILQNSNLQNKIVLSVLQIKLERKGEKILSLVCDLRTEEEIFQEIILKIGQAIKYWEETIREILEIEFTGYSEQAL